MSAKTRRYALLGSIYATLNGAVVLGHWPYLLGEFGSAQGELMAREVTYKQCGKEIVPSCLKLYVEYRYIVGEVEHYGNVMRNAPGWYSNFEAQPIADIPLRSGIGSLNVYYDMSDPDRSQLVSPTVWTFEKFIFFLSTVILAISIAIVRRRNR